MTASQCVQCILHYDNTEFWWLRDWNLRVKTYMIQYYMYSLTHMEPYPPLVTENNLFPISLVGNVLASYQASVAKYNAALALRNQERIIPDSPQK